MNASSFFDDCQRFFEREHESWKSYFFKWEALAKYEESVPESELFNKPLNKIKSTRKKKVKKQLSHSECRTVSLLKYKRNQKNKKKCIKKIKISPKSKTEPTIKEFKNAMPENLIEDTNDSQIEIILKTVFMNMLKANQNNLEMFAVLSQTFLNKEGTDSCNLLLKCQKALPLHNYQLNKNSYFISNYFSFTSSKKNIYERYICPSRDQYIHNSIKGLNLCESGNESVIKKREFEETENLNLNSIFHNIEYNHENVNQEQFLLSCSKSQTPQHRPKRKFDFESCCLASFYNAQFEAAENKPLEMDFSHKSPTSIFRKINREYFIKKTFPKMNIIRDGKRFRKLCLHKRTNSVSLSMENSNFITPEGKSSEWKCFSENVLQRKRRRPLKLFFDNEEDSESDDQTENRSPLIFCKNKPKTQIKLRNAESDSDDCESIFDRVKC